MNDWRFASTLAFRYLKAKKRNHFISFISMVSIVGIALGMIVLITVMSVMNGFDREIKNRMLVLVPHITVTDWEGPLKTPWSPLADELAHNERITGVAPYIQIEAMLGSFHRPEFSLIKGVDPARESQVSPLADKMIVGELADLHSGAFNVVLGKALAYKMGVRVGDDVTVFVPKSTSSLVGTMPRMRALHVVGLFETGFEYDYKFAVMHIEDAAKLMLMDQQVTGLQLAVEHPMQSLDIMYDLRQTYGLEYRIYDWTMLNSNLFGALKMEKTMFFFILALIVGVAAFNMLSSLVMLVTDKQSDIAILRTMGATKGVILRIFIMQGMLVGLMGTVIGLILGLSLAFNVTDIVNGIQHLLGVQFMRDDVYFINFLPSHVQMMDVLSITALTLLLSFLSTLYPAYQAAKVDPAEALRYE